MQNNDSASGSGEDSTPQYKVVLLGEGAVGKTSLLLRFVENKFNPKHVSTIQASFLTKTLSLPESSDAVSLCIWDTAGQEKFHALGPIYYRGSHAAVLVYDVADTDSFARVQQWIKELRRCLGKTCLVYIVGNKCDLPDSQRTVDSGEAQSYAQSVGARHWLASAKTGENVEDMFISLSQELLQTQPKSSQNSTGGSRSVQLADESDDSQQQSRRCCK